MWAHTGCPQMHPPSSSHVSILALTLPRSKNGRIRVFLLLRLPSVDYRHISTVETSNFPNLTWFLSPMQICTAVRVVTLDFPNMLCVFPPPGLYLTQFSCIDSASLSVLPISVLSTFKATSSLQPSWVTPAYSVLLSIGPQPAITTHIILSLGH